MSEVVASGASNGSIVVGRSSECDVVLKDPTVSSRHARLTFNGTRVLVEDLGSANGTFLRGQRTERGEITAGDHVRLGRATLSWNHPILRALLPEGVVPKTVLGTSIPGRRFICGACGARGLMPEGFERGELICGRCGARLRVGPPKRGWSSLGVAAAAGLVMVGSLAAWSFGRSTSGQPLRDAAVRLGISTSPLPGFNAGSPQEASIRMHTSQQVVQSIDFVHPMTRNTAVRIAADDQGPYHVEQVARTCVHIREKWRYVNDPQGAEYFAKASETIENGYAGDCDDFAALLVAMITAIGGEARIVMMDGPKGGHAYAEACIHETPTEVARRLARHYRRSWGRYRRRAEVEEIHFRYSADCPVWLNLDWNAGVPGGPYQPEAWAVGIYPDGTTETLAPAGVGNYSPPNTRPSASPPR